MYIFGATKLRGCWHEMSMNISGSAGHGAYIQIAGGGKLPSGNDGYFVNGFEMSQQEKTHFVQCFGDTTYTYAFGHNPTASVINVSFVAMLVDAAGSTVGQSLAALTKAYKAGRLFSQQAQTTVTIGQASYSGFLIGMTTSTISDEHSIQQFNFVVAVTQAQG